MARKIYFEKKKHLHLVKKANLPKTVVRTGESKSYTRYARGTEDYIVAKPGCKVMWG